MEATGDSDVKIEFIGGNG